MATLRRSYGLLRDVRVEQKEPDVFYSHLASDTAAMIKALQHDINNTDITGHRVLDVGGGPGYFAASFEKAGATYIALEPDAGEMSAAGITVANSVRGDGTALPFHDNSFNTVYSSNVAEHIANPWKMGEEMLRVTAPGGLCVISYTVWLGPFGGHETGLLAHYIGGEYARNRYTRIHGHSPKNVFGTSLFDVSCAAGIHWAQQVPGAEVELFFPRYHPSWAWWLVRVPLVREFLVSNLVIVLRKHSSKA
ncbi:class I SAM-dependent methyltransferase [Corynebacterium kutscheri]|nr:class I SAM-dependent methyltransferase [Corynebacterium kutscheri]